MRVTRLFDTWDLRVDRRSLLITMFISSDLSIKTGKNKGDLVDVEYERE